MNQKPLFLAVALITLIVIGGAFCFMSRRPAAVTQPVATNPVVETPVQTEAENLVDTVDWKTYQNEKLNLKFRYPKEYVVFDDYPDKKTLFLSFPENNAHRVNGIFFKMNDLAVLPEKLLEQINQNSALSGINRLISDETVMINSQISARKIVYIAEIGYNPEHYFFDLGGQPVELEVKTGIPYIKEILNTLGSLK